MEVVEFNSVSGKIQIYLDTLKNVIGGKNEIVATFDSKKFLTVTCSS